MSLKGPGATVPLVWLRAVGDQLDDGGVDVFVSLAHVSQHLLGRHQPSTPRRLGPSLLSKQASSSGF